MWGVVQRSAGPPTFALGIFLQFSARHVVHLGLSIKPRDGRLMMLAGQLSQESLPLFKPTHLYTGSGDQNAGPHMLWQMLCSPSHLPISLRKIFRLLRDISVWHG